ncbi:MAG: hypothetical protein ABWY25_07475 [Paenisporosarcina sp.]
MDEQLDKAKVQIEKAKEHVNDNQTRYACIATGVTVAALMMLFRKKRPMAFYYTDVTFPIVEKTHG